MPEAEENAAAVIEQNDDNSDSDEDSGFEYSDYDSDVEEDRFDALLKTYNE